MYGESENHQFGFICLFRSIRKNWIWKDAEKLKWWLDILMEVNHAEGKVLISGTLLICNRGESLNSLQTWAKRWHTDVSSVRRFLLLLQKDQMICYKSEGKTTRISVCNYESYNGQRNEGEKQVKRRRNADEMPVKSNNNGNNDNNGNSLQPVLDLIYTEEQKTSFQKFESWIATNTPSVSKMKEPFRIDEFLKLKTKFPWQRIAEVLETMETWEPLNAKRKNAYKTFLTFSRPKEQKAA
jgi:hypothetical protein